MPALAQKPTVAMPCGNFKGTLIPDLPTPYLRWVAYNWRKTTALDRSVRTYADEELQWREKNEVK